MGLRYCYNVNKRNFTIVLLISLFVVTLSGLANVESISKIETDISNSTENDPDTIVNPDSLELLTSYKPKLSQTPANFNLNDYESLKGTNLHFSGWLDYSDDTTNDMIFIVEFLGTNTPYKMTLFKDL